YANSHQNVIKYFAKNGKTTIANGLRSLKIEREKADYKLDLNIDYRIAKSSCGKARSIIKAIEKLQNDS
ncbi:MAG: hypothetical protein K8963_06070, partial [Proteobacteria bacterium]|nr:hypothetical protein [Pseudomonadota bacterium]